MDWNGRFNVVEVTAGPKAGKVVVLPVRREGFRLHLRNARYRLCNVNFTFADGFACGVIQERRNS